METESISHAVRKGGIRSTILFKTELDDANTSTGKRPICQDTGIVTCFVKVGMAVQWDKTNLTVQQMVDEGTRRAYLNPENPLRASIVADPTGARKNTKDNTPAVVHIDMVEGAGVEIMIAVSLRPICVNWSPKLVFYYLRGVV